MSRYRKAKAYRARHYRRAAMIDAGLTAIADRLPFCGNGRRHNASVMFADLFWTDCNCCNFYRGVFVGSVAIFATFVVPIVAMLLLQLWRA